MADIQLMQIGQKLDNIIGLLAAFVIMDKTQSEQIFILSKAGFQPKIIAAFVGTSPNTVRVCLSKMRKRIK